MRKLTIVLALAGLAASSGCTNCCIGRCRNWFQKGSPCGTQVAPAVLGAPLAMGTPLATPVSAPAPQQFVAAPQPMYIQQAPMCYDPCANPCVDPCADPCASGQMSMGYMGGYTSDGACCGDGSTMMAPMQMSPGTTMSVQPGQTMPSPQPE
jgi:hypothetical protein